MPASTYRFLVRPKWIGFHLLCAGAIVLMVNLAFWQMRRLDEKQDHNATVRARSELPIVALDGLVDDGTEPAEIEWRTVSATGTYLADEQLVVVNRGQDGVAGVNVVTPLELTDGRRLLVNRGFVPAPGAAPAPPSGQVTVEGRVRRSQARATGQLSDPADGRLTEVQRIDIPRISRQLTGETVQVYVDLLRSSPPQGDVPIPLPDPELSEGPHLSYTIQWFIFSGCVLAGWVLAIRRSAQKAAVPRRGSSAIGPPSTGSPSPTDDAATTAPR